MDEQRPLIDSISALSAYFVGDATMGETMLRVSQLACAAIGGSDQVGVTLVVDGKPRSYAFTQPDIPHVDRAQYETGDGPCVNAYETGEVIVVPSTLTSERYRAFCRAAAEHNFLSVLSFPLVTPQG